MVRRAVDYKVKYLGNSHIDIFHGEIYNCVAEWYNEVGELHDLSVVDESGEDYMYNPKSFEKITA